METGITFAKKVIEKWPAYKGYVKDHGIDPLSVQRLSDLPTLNKEFLSTAFQGIPIVNIKQIFPSSGLTNDFMSFGIFNYKELQIASAEINTFFIKRFNTLKRKTLLLNMLPGAISIPSQSVTVASIGVRIDTAINAIKSIGSYFDQMILVGEPLFISHLIEEGLNHDISWDLLPIFLIIGGEWTSESYRRHLESSVGHNRIYSSMGSAELGLNYFVETDETISLRRILFDNKNIRRTLLGNADIIPMLFEYNRSKIVVESISTLTGEKNRLALTTIDHNRSLPLIRYEIGDKGITLSRSKIRKALSIIGLENTVDSSGLPILAHFGRGKSLHGVPPEAVKEVLYGSPEVAELATGQFILYGSKRKIRMGLQLKESVNPGRGLAKILDHCFKGMSLTVEPIAFKDYPFPLDYDRKVKYINESYHCK